MYRSALRRLQEWKGVRDRHPLLLRGARQVGKTWLVRQHALEYEGFLEINLESNPEYLPLFKQQFGKPEKLLAGIASLSGKKIEIGKTLLFIDEIQESKEAILSLRYCYEIMPGQPVVAAGSLLEFCFGDFSFPVGRIDFFHLFPMNFEEYLIANGREDLITAIVEANESHPLSQAVHDYLMNEVAIYTLLGGLPKVVQTYIETKNWRDCQSALQILVGTYREDFYKYASRAEVEVLRLLFAEAPRLLGQTFKYSHVSPDLKSRELSNGLDLLEKAGLVYRTCHFSANGLPLSSQINRKKFKVFFLDIGLAQRIVGLNLAEEFVRAKTLLAKRGGLAEQFAAQERISRTKNNETPQLFYWHRESRSAQAEVDLLVQTGSTFLPIEVKSSAVGSLKSLQLFLKEKEAFIQKGLKVSAENFSVREKVHAIPFYALLQLGRK